tara:strand:+ start:13 stop:1299 length:1287 start_codon:yes stop_codon:yes gene_type:complete
MKCIEDFQKALNEIERIAERTAGSTQDEAKIIVEKIISDVKDKGDKALLDYTEKFDGFRPENLLIDEENLENAWEKTSNSLKESLELASTRIRDFHERQIPQDLVFDGIYGEKLGRVWKPVNSAGLYIPGGRASYPSTVLMNAIPAKVAGVNEIIMVSPANRKGEINNIVLAAAFISGIKKVFRIGGAQSIAALAFGTESIPKVNVISGPGNIYVTLAKKYVFGKVGIDSLAGPSEVLIITDGSAPIEYIAADLLAQAEHDPLAATILLTTSKDVALKLPDELKKQLNNHPREEICRASLRDWGAIIVCKDIEQCIDLSDNFAPEHLELLVREPNEIINKINNAGAIFLGSWTPEAIGDYLAGPNHTLPTSGTARFSSALGVETFMKNTSLIEFNKTAFKLTANAVIELAESEGLYAHSNSIKKRLLH